MGGNNLDIRHLFRAAAIVALAACISACAHGATERKEPMKIQLTSPAFKEGQPIPPRYTCKGEDISPALAWDAVPEGTKSLALIMDDPDAPRGIWVHWVLWNLPPDALALPEAIPPNATLDNGAKQGLNDFPVIGYRGPCPPPGKPHRYYFKLCALDAPLGLKEGVARKADLVAAMKGHVLAEGQLMGTFAR